MDAELFGEYTVSQMRQLLRENKVPLRGARTKAQLLEIVRNCLKAERRPDESVPLEPAGPSNPNADHPDSSVRRRRASSSSRKRRTHQSPNKLVRRASHQPASQEPADSSATDGKDNPEPGPEPAMSAAVDIEEGRAETRRPKPANGHHLEPHCDGTSSNGSVPHGHDAASRLIDRSALAIWRHPVVTLDYFSRELALKCKAAAATLWSYRSCLAAGCALFTLMLVSLQFDGPHKASMAFVEKKLVWWSYWVMLGVLSSVGLGTGLHTFLLYLGPHIAAVTLAAYECQSVAFPEPPYPDHIVCPDGDQTRVMSIWTIMSKVRWESLMWGAGTALGELPPYFVARMSRDRENPPSQWWLSFIERFGFFGILVFASVPNPFFDLAGLTCGVLGVPFATFFGATLLGKALLKIHIQKLFVIFVFSEHHVEDVLSLVGRLPYGADLQQPFRDFLKAQKKSWHRRPGSKLDVEPQANWLKTAYEWLIISMVCWFLISVVNSFAKEYRDRLEAERARHHLD